MAGRKVVDASDAQSCLAAAAASGLSGRDWAHQNGVDARSLHAWRMILGRKRAGVGAPVVRLVELVDLEEGKRTAGDRAPSRPRRVLIAMEEKPHGRSDLVGRANCCR